MNLPTVPEYAHLSWQAKQQVAQRLNLIRDLDTHLSALDEARIWFAVLPREPGLVCAKRRRVLEEAVASWRPKNSNKVSRSKDAA